LHWGQFGFFLVIDQGELSRPIEVLSGPTHRTAADFLDQVGVGQGVDVVADLRRFNANLSGDLRSARSSFGEDHQTPDPDRMGDCCGQSGGQSFPLFCRCRHRCSSSHFG
jgi:hypothetical protein